jgi:hypothetical protein
MKREREDKIGRREHVPVVVLTTGETATTRVLAVLADTAVTGRDVAAVLARLAEVGRHFLHERKGVSPRYSKSEATPSPPGSPEVIRASRDPSIAQPRAFLPEFQGKRGSSMSGQTRRKDTAYVP